MQAQGRRHDAEVAGEREAAARRDHEVSPATSLERSSRAAQTRSQLHAAALADLKRQVAEAQVLEQDLRDELAGQVQAYAALGDEHAAAKARISRMMECVPAVVLQPLSSPLQTGRDAAGGRCQPE